jgi:hypothetical protein
VHRIDGRLPLSLQPSSHSAPTAPSSGALACAYPELAAELPEGSADLLSVPPLYNQTALLMQKLDQPGLRETLPAPLAALTWIGHNDIFVGAPVLQPLQQ